MGEIIYAVLQFAGILAFAISGALVGVRHNLDLLGVIVVGASTGIGGGILRDILLGINPPTSLVYWPNAAVAVAGSLVVFFFHPKITRLRHFEVVFDAFGLGLFSANGAAWAISISEPLLTAVFVGTITAIGGGVVRDVLVNTVPGVLTRELYAVSAFAGAITAALLMKFTADIVLASAVGGALAIVLRLVSYSRGWQLPVPRPAEASGVSS
ncbi:TRIC cation channel family protein [Canibacter oris]|uniref:Putative membrane protein YeiH n=1 Tax=Canibacter oris TaxID=1365628 RepID=A0A840DFG1_9MICO|nr:putative membrane protein YeiH [Canibacter oris]